ncbi:heterokaryon incompatibility protein-domain-containing protein [Xylaria flabelliformis]|nr:heterokaryon incompatibility protein-domain-containing protein [Xylaria flabelliformis]
MTSDIDLETKSPQPCDKAEESTGHNGDNPSSNVLDESEILPHARSLLVLSNSQQVGSGTTKSISDGNSHPFSATHIHNTTEHVFTTLRNGFIRLLRLMPDQDQHATLRCQLFNYHLVDKEGGTHLYEALSYVWGSPEKTRSIVVNDARLSITENLHAALVHLRDPSLDRYLWVDSVCINQENDEERNRQVQGMARIYASASRVVVWLEEATPPGSTSANNKRRALEAISAAAINPSMATTLSQTTKEAIIVLLQCSWFRRIWILQEVAVAKHIVIMCHTLEIDGFAFCSGLHAMSLDLHDEDLLNRIRSAIYLIKSATLRPKYATNRSTQFSISMRPLTELIDLYHNREATDVRDKVYALVGMSTDLPKSLLPDYQVPWKDLFHHFLKFSVGGDEQILEIHAEKEVVIMMAQGRVLGRVTTTPDKTAWDDSQRVGVLLRTADVSVRSLHESWNLHSPAKSI